MYKKIMYLIILTVGIILVGSTRAQQVSTPELIAVNFHGDRSDPPRDTGTVFADLGRKLNGEPVLFVVFDRSNQTSRHRARLLASALGLGEIYKNNPGTGYMLLVDP